jgi:hypothetical protein
VCQCQGSKKEKSWVHNFQFFSACFTFANTPSHVTNHNLRGREIDFSSQWGICNTRGVDVVERTKTVPFLQSIIMSPCSVFMGALGRSTHLHFMDKDWETQRSHVH